MEAFGELAGRGDLKFLVGVAGTGKSRMLAAAHYDRHATYVALSRHRESASVFYAAGNVGTIPENAVQQAELRSRLFHALSRARPKELAHDYLDRDASAVGAPRVPAHPPEAALSLDDIRRQGREAWAAARAAQQTKDRPGLQPDSRDDRGRERTQASEPGEAARSWTGSLAAHAEATQPGARSEGKERQGARAWDREERAGN